MLRQKTALERPVHYVPSGIQGTAVVYQNGTKYAWKNSVSSGQIWMKTGIYNFFENSVEKIQVLLKPDENNKYFA
jgi:hypothetical protein